MRWRRFLGILAILVIWWLLALSINNEILLPEPSLVFKTMIAQLQTGRFYSDIGYTLIRMLQGLFFAGILGISLGLSAAVNPKFEAWFYPLEMLMKTIPNISYIIISLIWLGSASSVVLVNFLVLFPIFYANTKQAVQNIEPPLIEVMRIYPVRLRTKIFEVYLPLSKAGLLSALESAVGLGFKVSVMAEILGRVQNGIGFQIDYCRVNLEMNGVFAWTFWIIILAILLDQLFKLITKRFSQ